jgi:hypothetical protein
VQKIDHSHFRTSIERCGLFCAVSGLIDMINTEQEVDIFEIVKQVKTTRPEFIPTLVSTFFLIVFI